LTGIAHLDGVSMPFARRTALALAALVTTAAVAQDAELPDAGCDTLRPQLADALEAAPEMALGNRSKVERLLRDARAAESTEVCRTKLRRAYELIAQAYADAGESFALEAPGGG
jgi:hypothetical protein